MTVNSDGRVQPGAEGFPRTPRAGARLQRRVPGLWAAVAAALSLAGCASLGGPDAAYVPDAPGLYAFTHGNLQRLDGNRKWEMKTWPTRSRFGGKVQFVVENKALAQTQRPLGQVVRLTQVAWVRSDIGPDGSIGPRQGSRWAATDLQRFQVPVRVERVGTRKDVVRVIPVHALSPGLYSLQLHTGHTQARARLGVSWPAVNKRRYSAHTCVDHYQGRKEPFHPCAEQTRRLAAMNLKLYLVQPDRQISAGDAAMVIKGVIVNTSTHPQSVPELQAALRGQDGRVLRRVRFSVSTDRLQGHGSEAFQTAVQNPPAGVLSVRVRFARRHGG